MSVRVTITNVGGVLTKVKILEQISLLVHAT